MKKKPESPIPDKTNIDEIIARVHELAWSGQHAQAIELAAQALTVEKILPAEQMDLLDLRAESYIALGKLDLAAEDAAAMASLAKDQKTKNKS
jgi:murein endopeptidase